MHIFPIQGFIKFQTRVLYKYAIVIGHQIILLSRTLHRASDEMKFIAATSGVYSIRDGILIKF